MRNALFSLLGSGAQVAMGAAVVALGASVVFLRTRNFLYDALALAATKAGFILLAISLAAGVLWSRTAAGVWWAWDTRLTTALVCGLVYAAYLMLRHAIEEPSRRAASAAVESIFAFFDVPIIGIAVHWWLARHTAQASGAGWYVAPVALLGAALAWIRLRREQRRRAADAERRTAQEI